MNDFRLGPVHQDRGRLFKAVRIVAAFTALLMLAAGPAYAQAADPGAEADAAPHVPVDQTLSVASADAVPGGSADASPHGNFDRNAVLSSYNNVYLPAASVSSDWNGSAASCDAGTATTAYRNAALTTTNWIRSMVGQVPVRMDGSLLAEVQESSLLMQANNSLSHDPPTSWNCWTATGHDGASRSNLSFRSAVRASVVSGLVADAGANNSVVGHRWWILRPGEHWVEFGATDQMATMLVVDDRSPSIPTIGADTYWPAPGYLPQQFVTARWSVFAWEEPLFTGATPVIDVTMTIDGVPADAFVEHAATDRVVVGVNDADMSKLEFGPQDRVVDITITVPRPGQDLVHSWQTTFVDPTFVPPAESEPTEPVPTEPVPTEPESYDGTCNGQVVTVDMNVGEQPTNDDDVIMGTSGDDLIQAGGGDDVICAGDGADTVDAGPGDDVVFGGPGDDDLRGGDGDDIIRAGSGADVLFGGAGSDRLMGGTGDDQIEGGLGDDYLGGFGGDDTISGGAGNDTIMGGFGADVIDGGSGDDEIHGLIGDDTIHGGPGHDILDGDRGNDVIRGGDGDDVIRGGNAADELHGDMGDDELSGGKADDALSGGSGVDVCVGNKDVVGDSADATCESMFGIAWAT